MARLTRKLLKALGVEDESKQDEIIEAHTETVDALKNERDRYKADVEKYRPDSEKLADVQKELDELKSKQNEEDPYKKQYEDLKKEYDSYKDGIEAEKVKAKKTAAYKQLLKDAGVSEKRIDSILKVSSDTINSLEFDKDDAIKGSEELTKKAKEEWADFIVTQGSKGAEVNNPIGSGANNGGGSGGTLSRAAQIAQKHNQTVWGATVKGDDK